MAWVQSLAQELPHAVGAGKKNCFYFNGYGYVIIDLTSLPLLNISLFTVWVFFFSIINKTLVNILESETLYLLFL